MKLPSSFLARPICHRGLHDRKVGRVENSLESIKAGVAAGYGIEIDIQPSADGHAMVFHDDFLNRLTGQTGLIKLRDRAALEEIPLKDDSGTIPALDTVLTHINGQVPVVIEIKDQDGEMGESVGHLEESVVRALHGYAGDVALMSFNPHSVAACAALAPDIPRGIVTSSYRASFWPDIPAATRDRLRDIPDFESVGATFISHEADDLDRARVHQLKAAGAHILCWTIRSAKEEAAARKVVDNITFEGYLA